MPRHSKRWVIATLLVLWLLAGVSAGAGPADDALVQIDSGVVRGAVEDGYRWFQNIPYAAAPVADLRFKPPRPPIPWAGMLDATHPGFPCPQPAPKSAGSLVEGREDCLTINVTTPHGPRANRPLPVMVWLHGSAGGGGSFVSGSGGVHDGRNLVVKGNVLLVTFNYRLGIFGYLSHLAFDAESPSGMSGNLGLADQEAALNWVQRNIAAFGGDPQNVTVFGEQAGAASLCALLAAPTSATLFRRAILQSGACTALLPRADDEQKRGAAIAEMLGCPDANMAPACLRAKSTEELLKGATGATWNLVAGAAGIPMQPADVLANGGFVKMPLIVGVAAGKGSDALARQALLTESLAARRADLYAYELAEGRSPRREAEPALLFSTAIDGAGAPVNLAPAEQALADQMVGYWSEFAHKGDPNGPGLPQWPKFHAASDVLALATMPEGSHTVPFDKEHRCGRSRAQAPGAAGGPTGAMPKAELRE